jgi:hypothetical protein
MKWWILAAFVAFMLTMTIMDLFADEYPDLPVTETCRPKVPCADWSSRSRQARVGGGVSINKSVRTRCCTRLE